MRWDSLRMHLLLRPLTTSQQLYNIKTKGRIYYHFNDIHLSSCITQNNYEKEIALRMINIYPLYIYFVNYYDENR